jgi:hypothetical protein
MARRGKSKRGGKKTAVETTMNTPFGRKGKRGGKRRG